MPNTAFQVSPGPRERLVSTAPMAKERRLELPGASTAWLEAGEGPPVLLLHGPAESGCKWLPVMGLLARTHRVVAPDLPGHGETVLRTSGLGFDGALEWLDGVVEGTCGTAPVIVGHALGGAIALHYAARRAERVARLVLVDSLGLGPFAPAPAFGAALQAFIARPDEQTHEQLWRQCAFDLDALRSAQGPLWELLKQYHLGRARDPQAQQALHELMALFGLPAIAAETLGSLKVPISLVWGREDRATRLRTAEDASARYGWPLHVIDGAGDDPPVEAPAAFVQALHAAMAEQAQPGSDARALSRAKWDRIAPGYDRTNTPTQMAVAREGLRRVGLAPGMDFLDVAAGSGALSIPAAQIGARVLATDQSAAMLRLLVARAAAEGLQVETRVMDGHALALPDDHFDRTGSQFGVMLFDDMPRGLREMARVTRPGGRVLVLAYGEPQRIEFLEWMVASIRTVRPGFDGPPADPPPHEFQLADPARLQRELAACGLADVCVDTVIERTSFASSDALWDWVVCSNPIVEDLLASLQLHDGEREAIRSALGMLFREHADSRGCATLTNPVHIGIGTK